jgi:hypothetical protein
MLKKACRPIPFMVPRKYLFLAISTALKGSVVMPPSRGRLISPIKLLILEQKYLTLE